MKKLLLAVAGFLMLGAGQAKAQSFLTESGSSDTVLMNYTQASGDLGVHNNIHSATGTGVYLRWKVVDYNIPAGWVFNGVCDNNLCYNTSQGVLAGNQFVSDPYYASAGLFKANFDGSGATAGSVASITVLLEDTNATPAYSRTLTLRASKSPTSVANTSFSGNDVMLWPVPAKDAVNVSFDPNAGIRLASIYNLIGKAVSVFRVQGNSARLDIDNLPAGVYMLRLLDAQGGVIATRRFTHQ